MISCVTVNELFVHLIFPLIVSILPIILTYFLFEPLLVLIKKFMLWGKVAKSGHFSP